MQVMRQVSGLDPATLISEKLSQKSAKAEDSIMIEFYPRVSLRKLL